MCLIKKAVEEALKKEKQTINHKQLENHPRLVDNRKIKFLMKKKSDSVREVRED